MTKRGAAWGPVPGGGYWPGRGRPISRRTALREGEGDAGRAFPVGSLDTWRCRAHLLPPSSEPGPPGSGAKTPRREGLGRGEAGRAPRRPWSRVRGPDSVGSSSHPHLRSCPGRAPSGGGSGPFCSPPPPSRLPGRPSRGCEASPLEQLLVSSATLCPCPLPLTFLHTHHSPPTQGQVTLWGGSAGARKPGACTGGGFWGSPGPPVSSSKTLAHGLVSFGARGGSPDQFQPFPLL